jgi:hypothetical protein
VKFRLSNGPWKGQGPMKEDSKKAKAQQNVAEKG